MQVKPRKCVRSSKIKKLRGGLKLHEDEKKLKQKKYPGQHGKITSNCGE